MKILIIGAGNVGTNLHHEFNRQGLRVQLISARLLLTNPIALDVIQGAFDIYIYTVADQVLQEVINLIRAPKALHIHTSGTMPISLFGDDKPHAGVIYFFQSFSKQALIDDWSGIPAFIEGKNIDDMAAVYSMAQTLTSRIYEANRHDRERLHIAGVFANNFTNLMYRCAEEVLSDTQIPFRALFPLIDRTAQKIHNMPPEEAQTGPAKREDMEVMRHQLEILDQSPEKKEVYRLLSNLIMGKKML